MSLSQENVSNHSVGCGKWVQEKLAFGGKKWVGRRKVFRNPPDLMVLDPTGENDEL